jgi:pimeloyl-ACP methyl ester carboxylesterase
MNRPHDLARDLANRPPRRSRVGWIKALGGGVATPDALSRIARPALIAGAAAATGLAALMNYQRGRAAERAHPPIGRFMEVDGVAVHYLDRGEGPPVVLLHGNGAMAEDFVISGLVDRLARTHRVIAIDRPGYGYTGRPRSRLWTAAAQARLLREVVRRLGIERPVVVGHSWGAIVAMAWALDYQDELASLVLMSGYYYPTPRRDVFVFAPPGIPVVGDLMRYTISPPLGRLMAPKLIQKIFAPRPVPQSFSDRFPVELALRPWQLRASAEETGFMIPTAAATQARYPELRLPVMIITGDADEIITPERQSMRLHVDIPHSRLRVLPGLGHMLHYFAQDEIAAGIDAMTPGAGERSTAEAMRPPQTATSRPSQAPAAASSAASY